ncbi:MAG: N-acetyl-gamma-glutamyl-phosphate reductase [Alphaproteobacteria bacterium]|nr:N-acetyl-gamma-glutamyl-phosphate reductase [Alphaproteobacteria bacterium]
MRLRVGIVGVSGYGGGEALRLCATHPAFELVYAGGEGSAGQKLVERYPGLGRLGDLVVEKWDPERLPKLDLLFASLPTGQSAAALAKVPASVKIVDIGGDHRYVDGWTYGLADAWPDEIKGKTRVANPGCYPAAALTALAPLVAERLIEPHQIIIDAKTGVSGAGRGGGEATMGYGEVNEDLSPYGLLKHVHMPEIAKTIDRLSGAKSEGLVFTPHLVPMTRGILCTIYAKGKVTTERCFEAARGFYANRPFVRVVDKPPHTKWATGTNLVFVSYACDPARNLVIAMGACDNLGKGAAGQAMQNANIITGHPETMGLEGVTVWP